MVCHELWASWHCSSMFPNCTAEYKDKKPALPCKELCEEVIDQCTWSEDIVFLPFMPKCDDYPSKDDPYKKCSRMGVQPVYISRVAAAPEPRHVGPLAMLVTALAVLRLLDDGDV